MEIVMPKVMILDELDGDKVLKKLEVIGRTCYKSEGRMTDVSQIAFVRRLIERGHEAMLEHVNISMRWICNRGVSHEMVRHRIASYAQESTRYCNYGNGHIKFVLPSWMPVDLLGKYDNEKDIDKKTDVVSHVTWLRQMLSDEKAYKLLGGCGWVPQESRSALPIATKTEMVITMNLRELRTMLGLRCDRAAHPEMRVNALWTLGELNSQIPVIFDDLYEKHKEDIANSRGAKNA